MSNSETFEDKEINLDEIKKTIPYSEPFLFIDKIIHLSKEKIKAVKKLNDKEDYFKSHFVDFPIMPGSLILEGIGQAAALLLRNNIEEHGKKDILAHKIKEVKFISPAFPNSELVYEVNLIFQDDKSGIVHGLVSCSNSKIAEAMLMLAIVDKKEFRSKS